MKALALPIVLFSASALALAFGGVVKSPGTIMPPSPLDPAWRSTNNHPALGRSAIVEESTNAPAAPTELKAVPRLVKTHILFDSPNGFDRMYQSTTLTNWMDAFRFPIRTNQYQIPIDRSESHRFFIATRTNLSAVQ